MLLQKTHVVSAWPIVKRVAKVFLTNTTLKPITIRIANIETIEGDAILGNFFFFMYCICVPIWSKSSGTVALLGQTTIYTFSTLCSILDLGHHTESTSP